MLSVTENLIYLHRIKDTQILIQIVITQYKSKEQVTPKMITGNSFAPSFLEPPHTCLQYNT